MRHHGTDDGGLWRRLMDFFRSNVSLTVIVVATVLLELTSAAMYYSAHGIVLNLLKLVVENEQKRKSMYIGHQLENVEVGVENLTWVVQRNLQKPDAMFELLNSFIKNNSTISGASVMFQPYHYPEKGRWFEPFAGRRGNDQLESLQLGSANHDYFKQESFVAPATKGSAHWSEPYLDKDGSQTIVTTLGVPVRDEEGRVVAVINADIPMTWLKEVMLARKTYASTQRYLITRKGTLLAGEDNATLEMLRETELYKKYGEPGTDSLRFHDSSYVTMNNPEGEKLHVFYQPVIGHGDWSIIYVCKDSDIFSQLRMVIAAQLALVVFGLLLALFIVMRTRRHLNRLQEVNEEKQRRDEELRVANTIQRSFLPDDDFHVDGIEIQGMLRPAREVGGDLYDYYVRDGKLFFCIGDVSGKGAASAMLMSVTHSMFRAFSAHENDPARIMHSMNVAACNENKTNMFVTLFVGVLDLGTGHLSYCNAGHDRPYIIGKEVRRLSCRAHLPVGTFDDTDYQTQEDRLGKGDTIFMYTDGVTEARNKQREFYGQKRLDDVLEATIGQQLSPHQLLEHVDNEVSRYEDGVEQSDDLTMLVIRYKW